MKIGMQKIVDVEAKTLSIYCKVCDGFTASIKDAVAAPEVPTTSGAFFLARRGL